MHLRQGDWLIKIGTTRPSMEYIEQSIKGIPLLRQPSLRANRSSKRGAHPNAMSTSDNKLSTLSTLLFSLWVITSIS